MAKETPSTAEEKGSLSGYFKGAYAELKKVTWPTREETWRKSWIVIWFSVAFTVFLGGLDYLLTRALETII
jgi:preprotein translocase subunit SecE